TGQSFPTRRARLLEGRGLGPMTRLPLYVGFALGLAVTAYPLAAQTGSVEGTVTAAATREPVVGAEVTIAGSNIGVRTGSDGRFALRNVPAGPREVRVLAIGYRLATLRLTVSADQVNQTIVYIDGIRVRSEGYRRNRPPFDDSNSNAFRGANYQASPLNDINPADVDHIEVIKGSAASTLYGTEAAAGVIQIFTKHGGT